MTQILPHPDKLPKPKLSILIPTLTDRINFLTELLKLVYSQDPDLLRKTEILINADSRLKTIGQKRNELVKSATGEYVVFIDDDDSISYDYLTHLFAGINLGVDHVGIMGIYNPDNGISKPFKCSNKYAWIEQDGVYLRGAQHICCIKKDIAEMVKYPEINFGEDAIYSQLIKQFIDTEYLINSTIYEYKYRSNK
jgi:glycosyltransferase involved in cell wall biosynthesis